MATTAGRNRGRHRTCQEETANDGRNGNGSVGHGGGMGVAGDRSGRSRTVHGHVQRYVRLCYDYGRRGSPWEQFEKGLDFT